MPCRDAPWCVRIAVFSRIGGRTLVRPYIVVCNLRIVMLVAFAAMFLMFLYGEVL